MPNVKKSGALTYPDPLGPSRRPVVGETFTFTAYSKLWISYRIQTVASSTGLPPTVSLLLLYAILIFTVFHTTVRLYMFLPPERPERPTAISLFQVYLTLGSAALLSYKYPISAICHLPLLCTSTIQRVQNIHNCLVITQHTYKHNLLT